MTTPSTHSLKRYRGLLVWIDADSKRIRHGLIDNAILRQKGLTMAFTRGGHPYTVTLNRGGGDALEGLWTRGLEGRQVSGAAQCRLTPCGAFLVQAGTVNLRLEGVWQEDGQWDWIAKLRPLASTEAP